MLTAQRRIRLAGASFLRDDIVPPCSRVSSLARARNHGSARWIGRTQLLGPRSTECPHPSSLHNEGLPMRNRLIALSTAAAVIAAAASCGSDTSTPPVSHIVNFNVNMTPGGEVGANITSSGTGLFKATLDTVSN